MKYIMTLFWSMMLSFIVTYVLNSMADEPFILNEALIVGGLFFLAIISLGKIIEPAKQH